MTNGIILLILFIIWVGLSKKTGKTDNELENMFNIK